MLTAIAPILYPWKHQKTAGFLVFSGVTKKEHSKEMGWLYWNFNSTNNEYYDENFLVKEGTFPANIYLFKVNNKNITKRCKICSKLTLKRAKRRQWGRSGVIIVNFKHISPLLVFLLSNLNM